MSDIRVGRHDGFDRVVLEVGGDGDARAGTSGTWTSASSQGSGDPVEVAGDAVLQVTLTGAGYPYDTGVEEFSAAGPLSAADTEAVTEVVFDATYEGTTVTFVGTHGAGAVPRLPARGARPASCSRSRTPAEPRARVSPATR